MPLITSILVSKIPTSESILSTEPSLTAALGRTYYRMGFPQLPRRCT